VSAQTADNVAQSKGQEAAALVSLPIAELQARMIKENVAVPQQLPQLWKENIDPSGTLWLSRFLSDPEFVAEWGMRNHLRQQGREYKGSYEALKTLRTLNFPTELASTHPDEMGAAWHTFRVIMWNGLHDVLQQGVKWIESLRALLQASQRPTTGNSRIETVIKSAIADTALMGFCPPLHADLLIYDLDTTFETSKYGRSSGVDDWDKCLSRKSHEDISSMEVRAWEAFRKAKGEGNASFTREHVIASDPLRREFNTRIGKMLIADALDYQRGVEVSAAFQIEWEIRENKFKSGEGQQRECEARRIIAHNLVMFERGYHIRRQASGQGRADAAVVLGARPSPLDGPPSIAQFAPQPEGPSDYVSAVGAPPSPALKPIPPPRPRGGSLAPPATYTAYTGVDPLDFSEQPGYGRNCSMPRNGLGNPEGKEWDITAWRRANVDYERLIEMSGTAAEAAVTLFFPNDSSISSMHRSKPDGGRGSTPQWARDACRYCHYRPKAPASGSPPEDAWWYGTGDGNHSPYKCMCAKRYLCEGGRGKHNAEITAVLQGCIYVPAPKLGKGAGGRGSGRGGRN